MTDGVDASMEAMKMTQLDAPVDPIGREPELHELPTRHHAVLSLGQLDDRAVTWAVLTAYITVKTAHVSHTAHPATDFVTRG